MKDTLEKWLHHLDQLDLANRSKPLWIFAILLALILNLFLFLGITFLTGTPQDAPPEKVYMANAIRLMTGTSGDEKKKEEKNLEPEQPQPIVPKDKIKPIEKTIVPSPVPASSVSVSPSTPATTSEASSASATSSGTTSAGATGTYGIGDLDGPLVPISRREPVYPADARRREIEGSVRVRFLVNDKGRVGTITLLWAKPEGVFEKSVLSCVGDWRFQPPRVGGKPVSAWAETTLRFKLDE